MAKLNSSLTAMDWLPQMSVGVTMNGDNVAANGQLANKVITQRIPCGQFDVHAKFDPGIKYGKSKPPYSYANIITFAINSSQKGKMTLSEIYQWISEYFPYYNESSSGWKNSIRHNLSLNRCFYKVARTKEDPGKGSYWAIDPNPQAEETYNNGRQSRLHKKPERDQQCSPYREPSVSPGQPPNYAPSSMQLPLATTQALTPSPQNLPSPSSPHNDDIFHPPNARSPQICVSDATPTDERNCPLDNKVFAEHFSLEDLSASFKALYKTVFNQTNKMNPNPPPPTSVALPNVTQPSNAGSISNPQFNLHSSNTLEPSVITQPTANMNEKEVLETMETLMSSMNSGDWSRIMPDQFFSLIDSLQGISGLDPNDIDQLQYSYTNYLKFQGTFEDVNTKPDMMRSSHFPQPLPSNMSPRHSPYPTSQATYHSPHSPQSYQSSISPQLYRRSPQQSPSGGYVGGNHTGYLSPGRSPNHSRSSSLLDNDVILQQGVYINNQPNMNYGQLNGNQANTYNVPVFAPHADQSVLKQPIYANNNLVIEEDDEDFDWSTIM